MDHREAERERERESWGVCLSVWWITAAATIRVQYRVYLEEARGRFTFSIE